MSPEARCVIYKTGFKPQSELCGFKTTKEVEKNGEERSRQSVSCSQGDRTIPACPEMSPMFRFYGSNSCSLGNSQSRAKLDVGYPGLGGRERVRSGHTGRERRPTGNQSKRTNVLSRVQWLISTPETRAGAGSSPGCPPGKPARSSFQMLKLADQGLNFWSLHFLSCKMGQWTIFSSLLLKGLNERRNVLSTMPAA